MKKIDILVKIMNYGWLTNFGDDDDDDREENVKSHEIKMTKADERIYNDSERNDNDNVDDNQADDMTVDYCDIFLIVFLAD